MEFESDFLPSLIDLVFFDFFSSLDSDSNGKAGTSELSEIFFF